MNIEINCSIGEIYDKITILIIKKYDSRKK